MTTSSDLRRLNDQSRVRLAGAADLRRQCELITAHSRRRLDASRLLLERTVPRDRV